MTQQTELQKIASAYNGILWQLKGNMGAIKVIHHRLPLHGLLFSPAPNKADPFELKDKLTKALATAIDQLEYCEYLLRQLSESHRSAIKYTMSLTKEEKEVH